MEFCGKNLKSGHILEVYGSDLSSHELSKLLHTLSDTDPPQTGKQPLSGHGTGTQDGQVLLYLSVHTRVKYLQQEIRQDFSNQ